METFKIDVQVMVEKCWNCRRFQSKNYGPNQLCVALCSHVSGAGQKKTRQWPFGNCEQLYGNRV